MKVIGIDMGKRITLKDIAVKAEVGVATVDRVLNGRAPVNKATAERVLAAATQLGYHGQRALRRGVEQLVPHKRLGFVLQKKGKWYYQALAERILASTGDLKRIRGVAEIRFVEQLSPTHLADAMLSLAGSVDAIALVSIDHPAVHAAIRHCVHRNVPVVALLSPLSSPDVSGYVGIDGRRAGRTAGWAMARLAKNADEIGILVGSHRYLGHEALEAGFRSALREYLPDANLRDSLVYLDDTAVAYEAASELLASSPQLRGLYHCGGGVRGVIRALREANRHQEIFYICHERSPHAVEGLMDGTVDLLISNPADQVAARVVSVLENKLIGGGTEYSNELIDFKLITPENL